MFILKVLAVRYIPHFIENHNESESVHNTFSIVGFYWNIIINFQLGVMADIHSPVILILVGLPPVQIFDVLFVFRVLLIKLYVNQVEFRLD